MTRLLEKANAVRKSWAEALTDETAGRRQLALASFLESTIVPVPLEALVAPLMVANSRQAFRVAIAIWIGCLLGALTFYLLAWLLFEPVVQPGLEALGLVDTFAEMERRLGESGMFWTVFVISVTPAPFQLATLGAGSLGANIFVFMAAVALSRGIRYFGLAAIARIVGPPIVNLLNGKTTFVLGATVGLLALYAVYYLFF